MAIWIFIAIFGDIFRRTDIHGGAKAGWILLIFILPFLGCLIYMIARPKVTAGDVQAMTRAEAANKAVAGVSTADELAKLQQLKDAGTITASRVRHAEGARRSPPRRSRIAARPSHDDRRHDQPAVS